MCQQIETTNPSLERIIIICSVANLELNTLSNKNIEEQEQILTDLRGLIGRSLQEIRTISRNPIMN